MDYYYVMIVSCNKEHESENEWVEIPRSYTFSEAKQFAEALLKMERGRSGHTTDLMAIIGEEVNILNRRVAVYPLEFNETGDWHEYRIPYEYSYRMRESDGTPICICY